MYIYFTFFENTYTNYFYDYIVKTKDYCMEMKQLENNFLNIFV